MTVKRATKELHGSEVEALTRPTLEPDRDEEEAFEELVQAFRAELNHLEASSQDAGGLSYFLDEFVREDEFTCYGCNLILHRSLLSDQPHRLCEGCSAKGGERSGG